MTDLDQNVATQSPRRKFSFRFPNLSHSTSHDKDNASHTNAVGNGTLTHHGSHYTSKEKRNFSEEAKNVPDLHVSSKQLDSVLFLVLSLSLTNATCILWKMPLVVVAVDLVPSSTS